jgi:hypothetical protein
MAEIERTDMDHGPDEQLRVPDSTARVVVRATWQGRVHQCEKSILPERAMHHVVDKAVWDATVEVRRSLVKQRYGDGALAGAGLRGAGVRNEFEAFNAIRSYLSQHPGSRFELVPPHNGFHQWRAYFKGTSRCDCEGPYEPQGLPDHHPNCSVAPFGIETNPPVGIGSADYVAIENLLRFVEGRDTIDG